MPRLSQTSIDLVDTGFICNIVQERKTQSDRKSVQYIYIYISILIAWSNYVKITIIVRFIVSRARFRGFESIHIVIPDATIINTKIGSLLNLKLAHFKQSSLLLHLEL